MFKSEYFSYLEEESNLWRQGQKNSMRKKFNRMQSEEQEEKGKKVENFKDIQNWIYPVTAVSDSLAQQEYRIFQTKISISSRVYRNCVLDNLCWPVLSDICQVLRPTEFHFFLLF